jgi:hypothetical protein
MCTAEKMANLAGAETGDAGESEWEASEAGIFFCSACGAHAHKRLAFCPGCDCWMTNHA